MNPRYGLRELDIERLCAVFRRHPEIRRVLLYGSRAKGNYKRGSDIDIAIVGNIDDRALNQLATELDDLLLPYQLDIAVYEGIQNAELKSHIDRVGQPLFERD